MSTATRLKLTLEDHGREIEEEEFDSATTEEGYHYELIDGRVYVSPLPDPPAESLESWLYGKLYHYSQERPDIINYVSPRARIFIPGRKKATRPEPDIAAYSDYPHHLPRKQRRWQDFNAVLVVEVISEDDPDKDLVRNVELYQEVPTIREYWILDPRPDPDRPTLTVYRRRGKQWQKPIEVPFGEVFETPRFLPGFRLVVDPDQ
jgi:Uma2 family endonuclease